MKKKFIMIIPIWGSYIDLFFNLTFRSLLFDGNLNYLNSKTRLKIIFCTKSSEKRNIEKSLGNYSKKFNVNYCFIDEVLKSHSSKKHIHLIFLKAFKSVQEDHKKINFILQTADDFYASNNLRFILKLINKNKKINLVLENKILVNQNNFTKKIQKYLKYKNISKQDLVKLSFSTIDDFSKYSNPDYKKFNYSTYKLIFDIDKYNKLIRGYLPHPFLIRPKKQINKMKSFFDYFLAPEYVSSFKNIIVINNSNKFVRVGIVNQNFSNSILYKFETEKFINVLKRWVTDYHKRYVFFETLMTYKKLNKNKFLKKQKISYKLINLIDQKLIKSQKSYIKHPYWISKDPSIKIKIFSKLKSIFLNPILRLFLNVKN